MLRGYLPIGLKGRLPPTEPESWRMGDAPYKFVTVDKNPSYPAAIKILEENQVLPRDILMRQVSI